MTRAKGIAQFCLPISATRKFIHEWNELYPAFTP